MVATGKAPGDWPDLPDISSDPCRYCAARRSGVCGSDGKVQSWCTDGGAHRVSLGADQALSADPAASPFVFMVRSGILRLVRYDLDGKRRILGMIFPGEVAGLDEAHSDGTSLEAMMPAELCRVDRRAFAAAERQDADIRRAVYRQRVTNLERLRWRIWVLGCLRPEERICALLAAGTLFMPFALRSDGGGVLTVTYSRTDIADMLSTTPETISRVLHVLARRGILRILGPSRFDILDMDQLVARGGQSGIFAHITDIKLSAAERRPMTAINARAAIRTQGEMARSMAAVLQDVPDPPPVRR